jgi:hypothetical protein
LRRPPAKIEIPPNENQEPQPPANAAFFSLRVQVVSDTSPSSNAKTEPSAAEVAEAVVSCAHAKSLVSGIGLARILGVTEKQAKALLRDPTLPALVEVLNPRAARQLHDCLERMGRQRTTNLVLSMDSLKAAQAAGSPLPEDFNGTPPACQPTEALPGTPAKIEVFAARYAARQQLFNPRDAKRSILGHAGGSPGEDEMPVPVQ